MQQGRSTTSWTASTSVSSARAHARDDADQTDGRGPHRVPERRASTWPTCTTKPTRSSATRSSARCGWVRSTCSSGSTSWEGLDIPEVSLVAILDADQAGSFERDDARPDDGPGGPERQRRGRPSTRGRALERHGVRDRGDPAPPRDPTGVQRGTRLEPTTIEKEVGETNLPAARPTPARYLAGRSMARTTRGAVRRRTRGRMQDAASNLEWSEAADIRDRFGRSGRSSNSRAATRDRAAD